MKNHRRLFITVTLLFILVVAAVVVVKFLAGSNEGTISGVKKAATTEEQPLTYIPVNGAYATFTYASDYTQQKKEQSQLPVLDRFNFVSQKTGQGEIAIQITNLINGKLSDDGTYNLREVTTERFVKETRKISGKSVIIFTDKTGGAFSKVAYLQKGSTDASIALTGSNPDVLQPEFERLIASWQWR
jgi:hypothetical protein